MTEATGPQTWSVTVQTSEENLHGTVYDYDPRASVSAGPLFIDAPQIRGRYPDMYIAVISENGIQPQGDGGTLVSACEDLLKCEVLLDVPEGYFMLALLDLDAAGVDQHDYIDGLIFTEKGRGPIDEARVAAVEQHARAWMEGKVEDVPLRAFSVVQRLDCRREVCEADGLSGTASFWITPLGRTSPSTAPSEATTVKRN